MGFGLTKFGETGREALEALVGLESRVLDYVDEVVGDVGDLCREIVELILFKLKD